LAGMREGRRRGEGETGEEKEERSKEAKLQRR